jgi:hypothetical protein
LSISGKLAQAKIIKKIIIKNRNCNISPNTQHMALGQVSNGSDELVEQYDHGPRGKKQEIKFYIFFATEATVVHDETTFFWLPPSSDNPQS